jgi:hypothetical protein
MDGGRVEDSPLGKRLRLLKQTEDKVAFNHVVLLKRKGTETASPRNVLELCTHAGTLLNFDETFPESRFLCVPFSSPRPWMV